jgi:phosphatidylserine/phosphatidylglycerophosphate/cardiolipin synthase-like enzyme
MNIRAKFVSLALSWSTALTATATLAQDVDLTAALKRSNELFLATEKVRPYLYDQKVTHRLSQWLNHYKNQAYVVDCQFHMRAFFRSDKVIGPLCYFLRQDDKTRRAQYIQIVDRYVQEIGAAVHELADDPRYSDTDRQKARSLAANFTGDHIGKFQQCFQPAMDTTWPNDGSLNYTPFSKIASCMHSSFPKYGPSPYFAVNIAKEFRNHPGHAISPSGWIKGNKATYLYWNNTTENQRTELEKIYSQMKQHYPLSGAGSFDAMRKADLSKVFAESEGFPSIDDNPIWTEAKAGAIFPTIRQQLDKAKKTIFIDIFFLGSSMGASLAKHLVTLADKGIKIMILRDNYNHFGHEAEMRPVFNYLLAYAEKNPTKMVISGSYIKAHTSGLPPFLAEVVTDKFLEKSGLQKHLSLYGRAQSDHSKVFVIDGATDAPLAFVGSKNLTDASGAVTYDEVVQIEGPAAAAVQDDYYWDMFYALKYELPEELLKTFAQKGWSAAKYSAGQSKDEMVANVLAPFDLLGRSGKGKASGSASVKIPAAGTVMIRTGQNNVNSTRTNCVDEVVQMIGAARRNIYIKDQYLFDRGVVLALLAAKKKNPSLDIKVLLEPMQRSNPAGLPNLLYLDILKNNGIPVRWKKIMHGSDIHSEYHMKTISADGQSVISGSANKDQTTMYGSFREAQVDIWDQGVAKVHDDVFLSHWNDNESVAFNGYNFQVPFNLKGFDGKPMAPGQFIAVLRNVVSVLFDAQRM